MTLAISLFLCYNIDEETYNIFGFVQRKQGDEGCVKSCTLFLTIWFFSSFIGPSMS